MLREFAKLLAPIAPFYADYLFGRVRAHNEPESVHLCDWPTLVKTDEKVIADMVQARRIVTLGLEQRASANIKVRQPLAKFLIKTAALPSGFLTIVKDEMNVKEVIVDSTISSDVVLDTVVTDELRREGVARDLIRAIQEARKEKGLTVGDKVMLLLDSDEKGKELVHEFLADIKKVTLVTGVEYGHISEAEALAIEGFSFKIGLR